MILKPKIFFACGALHDTIAFQIYIYGMAVVYFMYSYSENINVKFRMDIAIEAMTDQVSSVFFLLLD